MAYEYFHGSVVCVQSSTQSSAETLLSDVSVNHIVHNGKQYILKN